MRSLADMNSVPYLLDPDVERQALELLSDYSKSTGADQISVPVPIDEILEVHLGLRFEYGDLSTLGEGVLGATYVVANGKSCVVVDETLAEGSHGRLQFTQAHEVGHWVLHRHVLLSVANDRELFGETRGVLAVACRDIGRSGPNKARGEYQADRFAGALLMPEQLVQGSWERLFGKEPRALGTRKEPVEKRAMMDHPVARDLARQVREEGGFENVSVAAMVVRLGQLGHLLGQPAPKQLPF